MAGGKDEGADFDEMDMSEKDNDYTNKVITVLNRTVAPKFFNKVHKHKNDIEMLTLRSGYDLRSSRLNPYSEVRMAGCFTPAMSPVQMSSRGLSSDKAFRSNEEDSKSFYIFRQDNQKESSGSNKLLSSLRSNNDLNVKHETELKTPKLLMPVLMNKNKL